jgi:hypothetical protein
MSFYAEMSFWSPKSEKVTKWGPTEIGVSDKNYNSLKKSVIWPLFFLIATEVNCSFFKSA